MGVRAGCQVRTPGTAKGTGTAKATGTSTGTVPQPPLAMAVAVVVWLSQPRLLRKSWDTTGQKFQGLGLRLKAFILTFRDLD